MDDIRFRDRDDAGRRLAARLEGFREQEPVILALPRGGVPVAAVIARTLRAPLDLILVRKIRAPGHPELGLGAVADGPEPQLAMNDELVAELDVPQAHLEQEIRHQRELIERRRELYLQGRPPVAIGGRVVIVVDDGIATGATVRVALQSLRRAGPQSLVLAVPVAPPATLDKLRGAADAIVCLAAPRRFTAVSRHYQEFEQTTDAEVIALLAAARTEAAGRGA